MTSPRFHRCAPVRAGAILVALTVLGACETEERIVSSNNLFSNIPGVDSKIPPPARPEAKPAKEWTEEELIVRNPNGTTTLRAPQIAHLLQHMSRELNRDPMDERLIYDQIVSEATKRHFRAENKEPTESIEFIKVHRMDLLEIMGKMPAVERTPGVFLERGDSRSTYRLRLTGPITRVTTFTELWIAYEDGNWRFYWAS